MKKTYCILFLCAFLTMVYGSVSCTSNNDKLQSMIPDDAVGVMEINLHSVLSKAEMLKDNSVTVPANLKQLIDDATPTVLGDIIYNLPKSGIDTTSNTYIFFSPGIYKTVALIPLTDEDAAGELVHKITSSKMKDVDGVPFATHLDYAYIIQDDVLLIGCYSTPVDAGVAARAASDILSKKKPSLLAKPEVAQCLNDSCDVSLYLNVKGFAGNLKKSSQLSTFLGNVPSVEIIAESDINAVTATVDFDVRSARAKVDTHILFQENGHYQQLYDNLIAANCDSASSILKFIPDELDTYVGIKIDGNKLSQMPQMSKMYETLEDTPLTSGLKIKDMLAAISGATVIGFGESAGSNYNFAIASQCTNPELLINQIVDIANQRGQSPMQENGEYIYDYGSQGIAMGQNGNAFYLRCVDFATGHTASELPSELEFQAMLNSCAVTMFRIMKIGNDIEGYFNWGLKNNTDGSGFYQPKDEKANVVVSLLKLLCWKEQDESLGDNEDDYDYGF